MSEIRATLDAWRDCGADRFDPVRFRLIEAMERRAMAHDGETRRHPASARDRGGVRRSGRIIGDYGHAVRPARRRGIAGPGGACWRKRFMIFFPACGVRKSSSPPPSAPASTIAAPVDHPSLACCKKWLPQWLRKPGDCYTVMFQGALRCVGSPNFQGKPTLFPSLLRTRRR